MPPTGEPGPVKSDPVTHDVIVLGGGAAGLFAAAVAGRRGRRVAVLERNRVPGRKILISGGGRCNFTNLYCRPEHFLSENPQFARSALARYTPGEFVRLVERHGITYHEKTLGQLFCDDSSQQVLNLLIEECADAAVDIVTDCDVQNVSYAGPSVKSAVSAPGFHVSTATGELEAPKLIVATGGLSIPKLGATDLGYRLAAQFGLRIVPPRPGLVPLLFDDADCARWHGLAGVATTVVARADGADFRERLLFTHRGLSGPAILQASSYWRPGAAIDLDLLPDIDFERELIDRRERGDRQTTKSVVAEHLPRRLADRWFDVVQAASVVAMTGNDNVRALADGLHHWRVTPAGTEGFEKAEVTAGGVDTRDLSSQTMEARNVPGLYFIGEVVDVTGHLGGFNFQWAWASASAAGQAV
jgi:predicted Rossmann fold flavoprotein